jgi:hypothetical protein
VPSANEVTKVKDYFSGHYQCHGVNVQATCDTSCCFTSLTILCPGVTGDSKAFYASNTYNLVEQLPEGFYIVAHNVYCLSSTLLIPYNGRENRIKVRMHSIFLVTIAYSNRAGIWVIGYRMASFQ